MIANYGIDRDYFYFDATLDATAIAALRADINGKNRVEADKKLKSIWYLCISDEGQRIIKARKLVASIKTERYDRVFD